MSKEPTLPSGTYRLKQTVKNPWADRRKTRDWTATPVWKAGETFVIETGVSSLSGNESYNFSTLKMVGERFGSLYDHSEQFIALAPYLEPVEETVSAMFTRMGVLTMQNAQFLRFLIKKDVVTKERFEELYQAWLDEPE